MKDKIEPGDHPQKVPSMHQERERKEKQEFLDRAFLSALQATLVLNNWSFGKDGPGPIKAISSIADRVKLGWQVAIEAEGQRPIVKYKELYKFK